MECQVFRCATGQLIAVSDKTRLPSSGEPYTHVRTVSVTANGGPMLGSESVTIIEHIAKFGFFICPEKGQSRLGK